MKFKTFIDIDVEAEDRKVLEAGASLSRIMPMLKDDSVDFGIITAFRKYEGEQRIPLRVNQQKNNELLKSFRIALGNVKGYGAYRLVGHWKECSVELPDGVNISQCRNHGGTIEDSLEESWLILNQPKSDKFFDVLKLMASKYRQDAFVARINGNFGLFGKDGNQWETFGPVTNQSLTNGFKGIIGLQGYSELKKKRQKGHVFNLTFDVKENVEFQGISVPNDTNSSHMLYKSMNILWK